MAIPEVVLQERRKFHKLLRKEYDVDRLPSFGKDCVDGRDCASITSYLGNKVPGSKRTIFFEFDLEEGLIDLTPVRYPSEEWNFHMSPFYRDLLLDPILKNPTSVREGSQEIFGRDINYYFMDLKYVFNWYSRDELIGKIIRKEIKTGETFIPSDQS